MSMSAIASLLQALLSLLLLVQNNPNIPPAQENAIIQLAHQVLSEVASSTNTQGTTTNPQLVNFIPAPSNATSGQATTSASSTQPASTATTPTCTMNVTPNQITAGQKATLSWMSTNAQSGSITQIGDVGLSGSASLSPGKTTAYYGTFTGSGGSAACVAILAVIQPSSATQGTTPSQPTSQSQSCTFNLQSIANGSNVTAYKNLPAPQNPRCSSQTRTCSNGVLSGDPSYTDGYCNTTDLPVQPGCVVLSGTNFCGEIYCPVNSSSQQYYCQTGGPVGGWHWSSTPCTGRECLTL